MVQDPPKLFPTFLGIAQRAPGCFGVMLAYSWFVNRTCRDFPCSSARRTMIFSFAEAKTLIGERGDFLRAPGEMYCG